MELSNATRMPKTAGLGQALGRLVGSQKELKEKYTATSFWASPVPSAAFT